MKSKYLFLASIASILFFSCSKTTHTVTKTVETTTDERDKLVPWSYKDALNPKSSDVQVKLTQFYISEQTVISRTTYHYSRSHKAGKPETVTEENEEIQPIDRNEKGEVVYIKRDNYGNIQQMLVSFDSSSYTYSLWFKRGRDGFFYLQTGEITYKRGEKFTVTSNPDCKLLFNPDEKKIKKVIKRKAKGDTVSD